ncbi:iron complex outermembrane receptor protein [Gelidibacter algens]|uniref:Iron complex outermembrane receptor protein n=1 Tax=Gelidibacter algens TaxID=49280 RepID=A0A1A7QUT8_9FLAO|nr:TonB-dependent receptor [Gelidibacter algens]OBX23785.1 TonB-dependent receptor [Gelidibacter algens]RAJ27466.1 iron complex outermembrane receptor protein [Gelidibacter algens]
MKHIFSLLLTVVSMNLCLAQNVSGTVRDSEGNPMTGVNVIEKGTTNGVQTDFEGQYSIAVSGSATLVFSYVGSNTQEIPINNRSIIDVTLADGVSLAEVVLVGSRSPKRTSLDTAVAIDIIDVSEVTSQLGKVEINELLQYAAPSFNANKQSGSDGADHIDPASLRGLGPDQTLVLINGKRRHQSSLINLFGTRGRGNTGTDLNAIPAASIKRIEILRDGAAAQYGSDAIAGVINIVLKDDVNVATGSINYGFYSTNADVDTSAFQEDDYGLWNTDGFYLDTEKDGNVIGKDKNFDGGSIKVTANYGVKVGNNGGFANFTTEYLSKNHTLRPTFDFRKGFGEAAIDGFNFFGNFAVPVSDNTEIYAFGGRNYRDTDAYAFTRNGAERVVESIYPNGFTPRITSIIVDNSVVAGVRTETSGGWKVDISNTYGLNKFHYYIKGTLNASLVDVSPTDFDAGGHSLSQNTVNFDISKYYDGVLSGMNLAFGAEYRTENFIIFAGEEGSWATYDINGVPFNANTPDSSTVNYMDANGNLILDDDGNAIPRPGGSQGFPGYAPTNEVDRSRSNISLYADGEFDLTDRFLVSLAARFEDYSDFGSTINGKLAARFKATDKINIRGSVSTGFRAPSLAQIYYNLRFTNFIGGVASDQLLSPNNSPVTASFGIGPLYEEKAFNAALGFTAKFGQFSATIDGYYIHVKDRIVLTGTFDAPDIEGVDSAQFFTNGVDTKTTGLDVILTWKTNISEDSSFGATFLGNFNDMKIDNVLNGGLNEQTFFGERDKAFLLASAPDSKLSLSFTYDKNWFDAGLTFTRFSEVKLLDFQTFEDPADYGGFAQQIAAATDTYGAKMVTDINFGFKLSESLKLNVGSNNLFNIYPDQQDDWTEGGGYWDAVQMGFGGAYFYAKMNYRF